MVWCLIDGSWRLIFFYWPHAVKLSVSKLAKRLKEVETNWMTFGIQLGLDMHTLKTFEDSQPKNLRDNFAEMLQYWLDNSTNPTWQAIFEALECVGNRRLISQLKLKHKPADKGISTRCPAFSRH